MSHEASVVYILTKQEVNITFHFPVVSCIVVECLLYPLQLIPLGSSDKKQEHFLNKSKPKCLYKKKKNFKSIVTS